MRRDAVDVKKVLRVGGGEPAAVPLCYTGWQHIFLDTRPAPAHDACDAWLGALPGDRYHVVYCADDLHRYDGDGMQRILHGFKRALHEGGALHLRVCDPAQPAGALRECAVGEETPPQTAAASSDHKAALKRRVPRAQPLSQKLLSQALVEAGFPWVFSGLSELRIEVVAFKGTPSSAQLAFYGLPELPPDPS